MKIGKIAFALSLLLSTGFLAEVNAVEVVCHDDNHIDLSYVIPCYRESLSTEAVQYAMLGKESLPHISLQKYHMRSQTWSPGGLVQPAAWQHQVNIYIPQHPKSQHALVVINNGINYGSSNEKISGPNDFSMESLAVIARATQTIVISVSNVPNQSLTYHGDNQPLKEDDSVARSWVSFLENPQQRQRMPLHIPMAAVASQTMRLAKQELKPWNINKFIVTGVSKRGWSAWLTFISDPDVDAVVPFVIDLLDTREALVHMYRTYGGNWPIAFYPYYQQGIDKMINTLGFIQLMKIEDPLHYFATMPFSRFGKTKYIVNASGDDFYAPDNARFYYDKLPGEKALRVVPNSDHGGIKKFAERTLVSFLNRFQHQKQLPQLISTLEGNALTVTFSEKPVKIRRWTAINPVARDFRYACGINYTASTLKVPAQGQLQILLGHAAPGWQATFVEATFDDGFVATSRVFITPDQAYPSEAPPANGMACQTLPGRGLGGDNS